MRKLLVATRSKGKFPEIVIMLRDVPFDILNLNDIQDIDKGYEVEEPASTFEGNAIIKAMTIGNKTGLITLADDSGLEVDALGGAPGVFSARYASGSDEDRNDKLLQEMAKVHEGERGARFRCVVAIYDPATCKVRTCEGVLDGEISTDIRGHNGFGYDPVFMLPWLGKTCAELSLEEKNKISHRGIALRSARDLLKSEFGEGAR